MDKLNFPSSVHAFFEEKTKPKHYPFVLALILMLCSWIFAFPTFYIFDIESIGWQTTLLKADDLLHSLQHLNPGSWVAKKVFRLTVPFFMKIFQIPPLGVLIIQVVVGYLAYLFSYKLAIRILKDNFAATLFTSGIAFLYFGRAAYFDINSTWFDAFAYFFLLMSIYSRNPILIFSYSTLAAWVDERAFIALSITFLFHHLQNKLGHDNNYKDLLCVNKNGLIVILSMISYLLIRALLSYKFGMQTPSDGANFDVIKRTIYTMPIGIITFLEGFWILFIPFIIHSLNQQKYLLVLLLALPIFTLTIVSSCVTDITRSGAYMTPIIFILIIYLKQHFPLKKIQMLLLSSFIICLIFPAMNICVDWRPEVWFQSTFIRAIKWAMIH